MVSLTLISRERFTPPPLLLTSSNKQISPQNYIISTLFIGLTTLVNFDWLIYLVKFSKVKPLILKYRRGYFVCHHIIMYINLSAIVLSQDTILHAVIQYLNIKIKHYLCFLQLLKVKLFNYYYGQSASPYIHLSVRNCQLFC